MTTVELAITNGEYLRVLRSLLDGDGEHRVVVVDNPPTQPKGLVITESELLGDPSQVADPERYVVIAPRPAYFRISQLWQAGFRRVVFSQDPPSTAYLAVLSAELQLLGKVGERRPASWLDSPVGLRGPFKLDDDRIDAEVSLSSPGVYLLGELTAGGNFQAKFAGRSDKDVNNQLHVHVGRYSHFQFEYCSSLKIGYEKQCGYFHSLQPFENAAHPSAPEGTGWKCPQCGA